MELLEGDFKGNGIIPVGKEAKLTQENSTADIQEGEQVVVEYFVSKGGQMHAASVEGKLVYLGNKIVRVRTEDRGTVQIDREDIAGVSRPGEDSGEEEEEEEGGEEEEEEGDYGEPPEDEENEGFIGEEEEEEGGEEEEEEYEGEEE